MSLSSISPGSLFDSPLASTLTASTNRAVSTGIRLNTASALQGNASYAPVDPLTQDLVKLLKSIAYGDIAAAKTDLAKYKADLKAQTTSTASNYVAKDLASLYQGLASASIAGTEPVNQNDGLVASLSVSLNSDSV